MVQKSLAVGVRRQIDVQETDQGKGNDDPAVATILTFTRTQISAGEEGCDGHNEGRNRERDKRRTGEERRKPAEAKDGHPEISSCAHGDKGKSNRSLHDR